ncbi:MAG: hypothetical protein ABIT70_02400 [Sulfuriferula sp.]
MSKMAPKLYKRAGDLMKIWEVRIAGPDDVIVFSDELEALQRANEINQQYLADRAAHPGSEVLCVATVHEVEEMPE